MVLLNVDQSTWIKLGQNCATVASPAPGFRNKKCFSLGKDANFEGDFVLESCSTSLFCRFSLSSIAIACWIVLFCPLFASILSRSSRFCNKDSIPLVVMLPQLLNNTVDNVW